MNWKEINIKKGIELYELESDKFYFDITSFISSRIKKKQMNFIVV